MTFEDDDTQEDTPSNSGKIVTIPDEIERIERMMASTAAIKAESAPNEPARAVSSHPRSSGKSPKGASTDARKSIKTAPHSSHKGARVTPVSTGAMHKKSPASSRSLLDSGKQHHGSSKTSQQAHHSTRRIHSKDVDDAKTCATNRRSIFGLFSRKPKPAIKVESRAVENPVKHETSDRDVPHAHSLSSKSNRDEPQKMWFLRVNEKKGKSKGNDNILIGVIDFFSEAFLEATYFCSFFGKCFFDDEMEPRREHSRKIRST